MKNLEKFKALVSDVKTRIKEVSIDDVKAMFDNNEDFHFVDVREESEFAKDALPQAMHIGKGVIERDIQDQIPNTQAKIVLYCGGGSRSALAAENLQKMGYTNVFSMNGGYRGWSA